jgi:hypothetical protein
MRSNHDRLRRTPDGRYEVGVYIEKNKYGMHVAQMLVCHLEERLTNQAKVLDPEPSLPHPSISVI